MSLMLITGGSGFIGSHFHQILPKDGLVNVDLLAPGFQNDAKYLQGDVRDVASITAALDTDPIEESKANAAFIVLACNSHYELLETLKQCRQSYQNIADAFAKTAADSPKMQAAIAKLDAAIAKAQ